MYKDVMTTSCSPAQISIAEFDKVLPELSNMLGGAYRSGQRFNVSASELFDSLTQGERELLKAYFRAQAQKLKSDDPQVAR